MAGDPVAFQPDAFQNDAFQTGSKTELSWFDNWSAPTRRLRIQPSVDHVIPSPLRARAGWDPILARQYRSPWPQATNPDVFPRPLSNSGWEVVLPVPSQRRFIRHDIDRIKPAPIPIVSASFGWEIEPPRLFKIPRQSKLDDLTPLASCPTVSNLPAQGNLSQGSGLTISLNFNAPSPSFILLGITAELEGGPAVSIVSVGGDASGLSWKKLAGGQVGATDFTLEYWGAFTPSAIASDTVTVTFNQSAESGVSFIVLAGVNATPVGRVVGPATVANNLFVTFSGTSPRSMLFAMAASEPDDTQTVTGGLNTTVYGQSSADQWIRSSNPTPGGALTLSTSGYTGGSTLYYLAIELFALPCYPYGLWGWDNALSPQYRAPWPRATDWNVLPNTLAGTWGWDPVLPRPFRAPWPQASLVEVFPNEIVAFDWGWEPVLPRQYRAVWPQATNPDVLPNVLAGTWGWDPALPRPFKASWPQASLVEVFPNEIVAFDWGWEPVLPPQYRAPWPQATNPDVLPNVLTGTWGWDPALPRPFRAPWPQASLVEVFPNEIVAFDWGWEPVLPPQYRAPWPQATNPDVLPNDLEGTWGWEAILPPPSRVPIQQPANPDVLFSAFKAWGWGPELPRPYKAPWPPARLDDLVPLAVCPTVVVLPDHGSASQEFGSAIGLDFSATVPCFILLAITAEGGLAPLQVLSVGGDASGLAWKKLAGGQFDGSIFTIEYWGAFAPFAIAADHVTVTFNESAESAVSFVTLAGVNPTPIGSVVGPSTSANNLFVTFGGPSPRSVLFVAAISEPDDAEPVAPGLNTTIYGQVAASQFVRSTNPTLGGMLTLSTNGYTEAPTVYYLGVEMLALPCYLHGLWGWDPEVAPRFPKPYRSLDVFEAGPSVLAGTWGWDPVLPGLFRMPWPQAIMHDVFPFQIAAGQWGWEAILPSSRMPTILRTCLDEVRPPIVVQPWGFEHLVFPQSRLAQPRENWIDIFPQILLGAWGWEASSPWQHKISPAWSPSLDVFPRLPTVVTYPWQPDFGLYLPPQLRHPIPGPDDWWPPLPFRPYQGAYKPWYGWDDIYYEDDDLRERLEREIERLDAELEALAMEELEALQEECERERSRRIIIPEVMPPGWQRDEQRGDHWAKPDPYGPGRFRHVHYNFASDLDFGIRRRIIGILDRAEHRGARIFGSDAFRTSENALVKGRFVEHGTHAWIIRLDHDERLTIAKEAKAEGFKLLSFDDTSLSFIHRTEFPWKHILIGAGAGASLMGAGIFTGWLIWGRKPRH